MKIPTSLTCAASILACFIFGAESRGATEEIPGVVTLNTRRDFPHVDSRQEWVARARDIRQQVLVSCGLWPMPEKTALTARIFDRVERDGYSVEKVYIQTLPGFYLAGNLYRPLGRGKGPFPGILNPHGHSEHGRLNDAADSSTPARCINFARQGMVAFCYDMVGYNDTRFADSPAGRPFYQVHRMFATNRADLLWNISLMGLQTWNSIRALDFLESLPGVDRQRLACTGESGGGTQTFMLGAIEDRLAAQAPIVMVSHSMQGGCLCENAPGLRVRHSNMELSAAAAPRPQLLVAATGDWTRATLTMEGPAIQHVYDLFDKPERFKYVRYDFGHNYNQTSREAVYGWFGHWLLGRRGMEPIKEIAYQKEPDANLRLFADGRLPDGAVTSSQLIQDLKQMHRKQWDSLAAPGSKGLRETQRTLLPAWQATLQLDSSALPAEVKLSDLKTPDDLAGVTVRVRNCGDEDCLQGIYWAPPGVLTNSAPRLVVLSGGAQKPAAEASPTGLAARLVGGGFAVLEIQKFSWHEVADQFASFYSTYNRTKLQSNVRDLVTLCSVADRLDPRKRIPFRVTLAGAGAAGVWSLLAAPVADAVVADLNGSDLANEETWLDPNLFCPGILNVGGAEGAALLAAPRSVFLHNAGPRFAAARLERAFATGRETSPLRIEPGAATEDTIAAWVGGLK